MLDVVDTVCGGDFHKVLSFNRRTFEFNPQCITL